MSDSDDDNNGIDEAIETSAKAKNLRKAITNNLGGLLTSLEKEKMNNSEEEEEVEEEDDEEEDDEAKETEGNDDNSNAEKNESFIDQIKNNVDGDNNDSDSDEEEEDEDKEGTKVEKKYKKLQDNNYINSKALSVVAAELTSIQSKLPWAETFVIVPPTPLPFGENGDPESNPLDIHDDLKREVAFYNTALEAVNLARPKCQEFGIPFSRPEDFFVEMVKTDDHMANVKDRLIFENKKIEAVASRKSSKEQKLRAKESNSNRLAEKAKRKKDHFQEVEEWANSAAKQRGGALRDDMDDHFLNNRNSGGGPGKKRQIADKKFGFGGKKGRF